MVGCGFLLSKSGPCCLFVLSASYCLRGIPGLCNSILCIILLLVGASYLMDIGFSWLSFREGLCNLFWCTIIF